MKSTVLALTAALSAGVGFAHAAPLKEMPRHPTIRVVPSYSPAQRQAAAKSLLKVAKAPQLGQVINLTVDSPRSKQGFLTFHRALWVWAGEGPYAHFDKDSFGHVLVTYATPASKVTMADCKMTSSQPVKYEISTTIVESTGSVSPTADAHVLFLVPSHTLGTKVSVRLNGFNNAEFFFYGCELTPVG